MWLMDQPLKLSWMDLGQCLPPTLPWLVLTLQRRGTFVLLSLWTTNGTGQGSRKWARMTWPCFISITAIEPVCQRRSLDPCPRPSQPGGYAKLFSLAIVTLPQDEEMAAQGVQVLKEDILDKTVKLNVEYKTGGESFVSVHIGDEDVGKNLVEDGLLLVDRKGGRKLEALVKSYDDAMNRAKKNHLNIWQYGDITQDDSREFGAPP